MFIYKDKDLLYFRQFGKALKQDIFSKLVEELMKDAFSGKSISSVQTYDYYKYKITYAIAPEERLIFLFVTGLTDRADSIQKELIKCKKEFLNLFGDIIDHKFDAKTFDVFDTTVDSIHRNLRPKISLVGFSGVGKTTITKLIKAEEIPMKHIPTITGDIATIKIGKLHFHLWDFAGQEQFSYLWNNFVKGSDAVLLITDSSLENVEKSKFFLELIKDEAPDAHTAVIGNKQDLTDALKPQQIEKILGLKTYSMVATATENRDKMIQIIADILEMSAEISPLLKPLLQRDKFTEDAMNALENGEFNKAILLFQKISDLSIELGDDSLGREFYDKAEKIKEIMSSAEELETTLESSEEPQISEPIPPPSSPPKAPEILKKSIISTIPKPPPQFIKKSEVPEKGKADENVEKIEIVLTPPLKIKSTRTSEEIDKLKTPENIQIPLEGEKIKKEKAPKKEKSRKKEKPAKKLKKRKKEKISIEEEPKISSVIEKPSFLKAIEAREAQSTINQQNKMPKTEDSSNGKPKLDISWMPEKLKRIEEQKSIKNLSEGDKIEDEEKILIKPSIPQTKTGLKLKPEDFIIKQRPKKILNVPDDAKAKLKTSAYGHVKNPDDVEPPIPTLGDPKKSIKTESKSPESLVPPKPPEAKAPATLIKPKIPIAPALPKTPAELKPPESSIKHIKSSPTSSETSESDTQKFKSEPSIEIPEGANKKQLEKSLMELKIKKAKLQEMALDFDMQELSGEITTEELKEKKMKLLLLENKTDKQILEIQRMIDKL